jgi:hypothetical protein
LGFAVLPELCGKGRVNFAVNLARSGGGDGSRWGGGEGDVERALLPDLQDQIQIELIGSVWTVNNGDKFVRRWNHCKISVQKVGMRSGMSACLSGEIFARPALHSRVIHIWG